MHSPLMLEGRVTVDNRDEIIAKLREDNRHLSEALARARSQASTAELVIGRMRNMLEPFYDNLRYLFGEMESVPHSGTVSSVDKREHQVWESWKQKLGGMSAKFIDALLLHGEMSAAQLRVAMQCRLSTVYDTSSKLGKLGLLSKNGGKYSLRQL